MKKIMLVGTETSISQEIQRGLSKEYVVLNSSRGLRALDLLRLFEPEALILLKTSESSDFQRWVDRTRSISAGQNIPILLWAPKGDSLQNVSDPNLHALPTALTAPILRAILKGLLNHEAALAR